MEMSRVSSFIGQPVDFKYAGSVHSVAQNHLDSLKQRSPEKKRNQNHLRRPNHLLSLQSLIVENNLAQLHMAIIAAQGQELIHPWDAMIRR